ncbi:MAG: hypothetical protein ACHQ2Z_00420 [Elusimicrobiota bacterium]
MTVPWTCFNVSGSGRPSCAAAALRFAGSFMFPARRVVKPWRRPR